MDWVPTKFAKQVQYIDPVTIGRAVRIVNAARNFDPSGPMPFPSGNLGYGDPTSGKSAFKPWTAPSQTGQKKNRRTQGRRRTIPGRSGGFVKTTKRVTRPGKKSIDSGYEMSCEFGGTGTDTEVGVLGHITAPVYLVRRCLWGAILKKLLELAGLNIVRAGESIPNLENYDKFTVVFQKSEGVAVDSETYTVSGTPALTDLVDWCNSDARAWNDESANWTTGLKFAEIRFSPYQDNTAPEMTSSRKAYMSLKYLRFNMAVKSALKMQNRTVVTAGDDEADVNNQPLYGKGFSGKGTGAEFNDYYPGSFKGDKDFGLITGGDVSNAQLEDIANPRHFKYVKRTGKLRVEPGEIKTSVLTDKFAGDFNAFYRQLINNAGVYSTGPPVVGSKYKTWKVGKFRFFMYEKILDTGAAFNIVMAFEHAIDMKCKIFSKTPLLTIKEFRESKNIAFD